MYIAKLIGTCSLAGVYMWVASSPGPLSFVLPLKGPGDEASV